MRSLFFIALLAFCFLSFKSFAQYYDVGEDPSWVKWRQIETNNFILVYPSTLDSAAKRYAWLFDQTSDKIASGLETKLKKIPVVLHAYNLRSNGLVTWAPSRMELNTSPPNDGYPQSWDKQLVLHETRHAAQMSKVGDNVIKYAHWLIGEQAEGLFVGIFIPSWYLEGDATATETAFSSSGRGRYAHFLMPQKAYLLDDMHFTWDQWKMGSYRYPVPGAYELGYSMSAYATLHGGQNVFGKSLDYSTRKIYDIPPFDKALAKFAGGGEQDLQRESFAILQEQWKKEDSLRGADVPSQPITISRPKDYTAYGFSVITDEGKVLALRASMNRSLRLVELDSTENERMLRPMGSVNSRPVYYKDYVYWTETVPHPRWPQQNYSDVYAYHVPSDKLHRLTRHNRFSGVSISSDGTRLITIENSPEGQSRIVLLPLLASENTRPKILLQDAVYVSAPVGGVWKDAVWGDEYDGAPQIFATLLGDEGMRLYSLNPVTKQMELLLAPGYTDIKRPIWWKKYLIFGSGYDGRDNLYALEPRSNQLYKLTNARLGAFMPIFDKEGKNMVYADYHAYGYQLKKIAVDSLLWQPESFTTPYKHVYADSLTAATGFNIDEIPMPSVDSMAYESKPYNKLTHLFRFHSWAPLYLDPDELLAMELEEVTNNVGLGATVFTQNSLSTAIGRLGYHYNNGFHSGHLNFTYKGWYPVFDFRFEINDRYALEYRDLRVVNDTLRGRKVNITDPYIEAMLRVYVPFNFSSGGWQRSLILQAEEHFTNDRYYKYEDPTAYYYHYFVGAFTWFERMNMAARELYPRWGYMIKGQYLTAPFGKIQIGHVGCVQLTTYSPGMFRNHSVVLKGGYQWQFVEGDGYYLQNLLNPPRGYTSVGVKNMLALSANYALPLFYPDWNLAWLFYCKRIQMTAFTDFARIQQYHDSLLHEWSVGFDLVADYHIFRFDFPVQTGIRCAFPLTEGVAPSVSLLFNISF